MKDEGAIGLGVGCEGAVVECYASGVYGKGGIWVAEAAVDGGGGWGG